MRRVCKAVGFTAALAMSPAAFLSGTAAAQEAGPGQREYEENCAVCHGTSGQGDGPLAGMITQKVSDLTMLSKNNEGVFPFNRIYEIIDGRGMVEGHGTRDMPVWGHEYNAEAAEYYTDFPAPYNSESFIRGRILALVGYIHQLQAE